MISNDIFVKIQGSEKSFTKAEHKVSDFIFHHPRDIMYMSITDPAKKCGVGGTTVFGFVKTKIKLQNNP